MIARALMIMAVVLAFTSSAMWSPANSAPPRPAGQRLFLQCQGCHSIKSGEPNKIGPNLAGIVGTKAATRPGYPYSAALKGAGLTWDAVTLDRWLISPSGMVAGTKMIYPGMASPADRAAVIAFLRHPSH